MRSTHPEGGSGAWSPVRELQAFFRAALVDPIERHQPDTPARWRRRQIVVAVTVVLGTLALGAALSVRPGDPLFYPATLAVAAVWTIGALAAGKMHLGRARTRSGELSSPALQGFLLGALLLAGFLVGALVVARVEWLRSPVLGLLDHAAAGSLPAVAAVTVVNGIAEELFFRGAVYAALPRRFNLLGSTALYAASTLLSGVPLLTLAAGCLGFLTGLQRRVTGGLLGPIVSHLTWSVGMLLLLPHVITIGM